ncbi:TetR/AcrR family transcriptional regulator [Aquihabitans sp. G128]|uniref:TetR/AcrR family transcriptional regulator n=1 Tax=Aquihabitans sp. G128 TaxID=2849779 RepID=UPI001C217552|nr:helix-turn-helix domain-containing protein [Aquihabitans sp. G128]QXC60525.1 TetR/AcrR family transcriptional regulator [Aquihabitans sp. G128]
MADRHDAGKGVPGPAVGRPRDSRIAEEVLAATRASLTELGWERTSMRGVAERAGVSRPAIARRWPSKTHLVLEAILGAAPDLGAFDGVDTAGWISGVIAGSFDIFDRPEVRAAAPGLLATLRDHPDIREALWLGFSGPASALVGPVPAESVDGARGSAPLGSAMDRLVDAQAAIVLAAGAALFLSLVVGDDDRVRDRVTSALSASMAKILDLET